MTRSSGASANGAADVNPSVRTIGVPLTERVLERAQTAATRCELPLSRWIAEAVEAQLAGVACRHESARPLRHDPVRDVPPPEAGPEAAGEDDVEPGDPGDSAPRAE